MNVITPIQLRHVNPYFWICQELPQTHFQSSPDSPVGISAGLIHHRQIHVIMSRLPWDHSRPNHQHFWPLFLNNPQVLNYLKDQGLAFNQTQVIAPQMNNQNLWHRALKVPKLKVMGAGLATAFLCSPSSWSLPIDSRWAGSQPMTSGHSEQPKIHNCGRILAPGANATPRTL